MADEAPAYDWEEFSRRRNLSLSDDASKVLATMTCDEQFSFLCYRVAAQRGVSTEVVERLLEYSKSFESEYDDFEGGYGRTLEEEQQSCEVAAKFSEPAAMSSNGPHEPSTEKTTSKNDSGAWPTEADSAIQKQGSSGAPKVFDVMPEPKLKENYSLVSSDEGEEDLKSFGETLARSTPSVETLATDRGRTQQLSVVLADREDIQFSTGVQVFEEIPNLNAYHPPQIFERDYRLDQQDLRRRQKIAAWGINCKGDQEPVGDKKFSTAENGEWTEDNTSVTQNREHVSTPQVFEEMPDKDFSPFSDLAFEGTSVEDLQEGCGIPSKTKLIRGDRCVQSEMLDKVVTDVLDESGTASPLLPVPSSHGCTSAAASESTHSETQKSTTACEASHINNKDPPTMAPLVGNNGPSLIDDDASNHPYNPQNLNANDVTDFDFSLLSGEQDALISAMKDSSGHSIRNKADGLKLDEFDVDRLGFLIINGDSDFLKYVEFSGNFWGHYDFDFLLLVGGKEKPVGDMNFSISNHTRTAKIGLQLAGILWASSDQGGEPTLGIGCFHNNNSLTTLGRAFEHCTTDFHGHCSYELLDTSNMELVKINIQTSTYGHKSWVNVATSFQGGGNLIIPVFAYEVKIPRSWVIKMTAFKGGTVSVTVAVRDRCDTAWVLEDLERKLLTAELVGLLKSLLLLVCLQQPGIIIVIRLCSEALVVIVLAINLNPGEVRYRVAERLRVSCLKLPNGGRAYFRAGYYCKK